jgi:hypothetical protein
MNDKSTLYSILKDPKKKHNDGNPESTAFEPNESSSSCPSFKQLGLPNMIIQLRRKRRTKVRI